MRDDEMNLIDALPFAVPSMADEPLEDDGGGGTGVAEPPPKPKRRRKPKSQAKPVPKRKPPGMLPPWKVLLHNDDVNTVGEVVVSLMEITPLDEKSAVKCTLEADRDDVALILVTHKERAELYVEQFQTRGITVTIEPAEKG